MKRDKGKKTILMRSYVHWYIYSYKKKTKTKKNLWIQEFKHHENFDRECILLSKEYKRIDINKRQLFN